MQGNDFCLGVAETAGMGCSPQPSPNHHVTAGTHAGSWVHIPVNENVPIALQMVSGPQCSAMNKESILVLASGRWLFHLFDWMDIESHGRSTDDGFWPTAAKPSEPAPHAIQDLQQLLQISAIEVPVTAIQLHSGAGFLFKQSRQSVLPML